ncbi:hypothetical protein DB347_08730 [Opitutaceae bacterium EW11]|nr:hypothetical protein DB347_08730 [Opitutaceae bacterium EW11]
MRSAGNRSADHGEAAGEGTSAEARAFASEESHRQRPVGQIGINRVSGVANQLLFATKSAQGKGHGTPGLMNVWRSPTAKTQPIRTGT